MTRSFKLLFLVLALVAAHAQACAATWNTLPDGRPLSYDRLGLVPLTKLKPLDPADKEILAHINKYELSDAVRKARAKVLKKDDDFHAAWLLVQAARLRGTVDVTIRDLEALLEQRKERIAVRYALIRLHDSIRMDGFMYVTGNRTKEALEHAYFRHQALLEKWLETLPRETLEKGLLPLPIVVTVAEDAFYAHGAAARMTDAFLSRNGDDPGLRLYLAFQLMSGRHAPPREQPGGIYADTPRAEQILKKLRGEKPPIAEALYFLGDLRVRQRRPSDAKRMFQEYLNSKPSNPMLVRMAKEYVETGSAVAIRKKFPI